jgi:hypothetical protein
MHLQTPYSAIIRSAPVAVKLRVLTMPTPRFPILLLFSVVALVFAANAAAGVADRVPAGTGSNLVLDKGKGLAVLTSKEGTVGVTIKKGSVTFVDYPRDATTTFTPFKNWGCEKRRHPNRKTYICSGQDLRFFIVDGAWIATLRGRGISASAVVVGKCLLKGTRGTYSIDGSTKRAWPSVAQTYKLGH